MTIKELKDRIKNVPDDWEVVIDTQSIFDDEDYRYEVVMEITTDTVNDDDEELSENVLIIKGGA